MLSQEGPRASSPERRLPGQHLEEHASQGVLVAPSVQVPFAGNLLRARIGGGAQGRAGLGEPLVLRLGHGVGDPEVGQHRMARLEHDVGGLHVSMDDAFLVRICEGAGDLPGDSHRILEGETLLVLEASAQGGTLYVWHDEEQEAVGFPRVMQR